jgi:hypothetical protein
MLNQASFILIDSALERGPQEYNGSIWVAGITMTGEHRGQSVIQYSGPPSTTCLSMRLSKCVKF